MLTTVHEYAAALLAPAESERLQARHAAYYVTFAQQVERELYRPQQVTWLAMARAEEDNLRVALSWSLASGEPGERVLQGMRIAKALARYWQIAGRLAEGRAWLIQAVAVRYAAPVDLQVEVLGHAGLFAQLQGDYAAASALHEDVLTLAHDSGNAALVAQALYSLGTAAGRSGDPARASELFAECLAIRRKLPPGAVTEAQLALTLNNLAVSHLMRDEYAPARALLEESLALKRKSGDQVAIATALVNLGDLAFREGDLERAEALQRESMQLRVAIDDKLGLAKSLDHMGDVAAMRGHYLRAATLFAASLAAHNEIQATRALSTAQQVEKRIALVRAALDPQAYAAATARGERMTLDEAVRYALARP
jgi:tetratricopeptide (TPR) repeat protein